MFSSHRYRMIVEKKMKQNLDIFETAVPLAMILIPTLLMFTSLVCECIPFGSLLIHSHILTSYSDITLPAFYVLTLHPLIHNLILLTVTPAYRQFIIATIKKPPVRLCPRSAQICSIRVSTTGHSP